MNADEKTWTPQDVSEFLRVPIDTLYRWRYLGVGPNAYRVGKHLRYLPDEVRAWLAEQAA
jgi:hypothetical protein